MLECGVGVPCSPGFGLESYSESPGTLGRGEYESERSNQPQIDHMIIQSCLFAERNCDVSNNICVSNADTISEWWWWWWWWWWCCHSDVDVIKWWSRSSARGRRDPSWCISQWRRSSWPQTRWWGHVSCRVQVSACLAAVNLTISTSTQIWAFPWAFPRLEIPTAG